MYLFFLFFIYIFINIFIPNGTQTLYSTYEEVLKPNISHTPTEWTRDSVTVTIAKEDHPEYSFKYKKLSQ